MNEFPYTDEQVRQFTKAREYPRGRGATDDVSRDILECCHRAGITVTFPEPRYYVSSLRDHSVDVLDRHQRDRYSEGLVVASFRRAADGKRYAQEHADRLNAEETTS